MVPGEHVVLDAHTAYQLRWEENCNLFHVRIPRAAFEASVGELTGVGEADLVRFPLRRHPSKQGTVAVAKVMRFLLANAGPNGLLSSGALLRAQLRRMLVASLIEAYCGDAMRPLRVPAATSGRRPFVVRSPTSRNPSLRTSRSVTSRRQRG